MRTVGILLAAFGAFGASAAYAGPDCGETAEGFSDWLPNMKLEAKQAGVNAAVVEATLSNVAYSADVVSHDRRQGPSLQGDVMRFAAKRVTPYRVKKGKAMTIAHAEELEAIEAKYGVPAPVLVAIWGMESEFGAGVGTYPTFSSLATLAYDCRRSDQFHEELIDALRLAQRGVLSPESRGAWAGEIGQTQFMPSVYLHYAVSYSGFSKPDLVGNPADALASTANFLRKNGWQAGAGYHQGQPNFQVLQQWNEAPVYAGTIALFADRLAQ